MSFYAILVAIGNMSVTLCIWLFLKTILWLKANMFVIDSMFVAKGLSGYHGNMLIALKIYRYWQAGCSRLSGFSNMLHTVCTL